MQTTDKKYLKLGIIFLVLEIGLLVFVFMFGINSAVGLAFILHKGDTASKSLTEDLLPAPRLYNLPEATDSASLATGGIAQANQLVDLYLNSSLNSSLSTDSEGVFTTQLTLSPGENTIYAISKTVNNKISKPSEVSTIRYIVDKPKLAITEPTNETNLRQRSNLVTVKGSSDVGNTVSINDQAVVLDRLGAFTFQVALKEGDNTINISATNEAGNTTEENLLVRYTKK